MRVKIKTVGHQFYSEEVGVVLLWSSGFIRHSEKGLMPVPCVVIKTEKAVKTIALQEQYRDVTVEILEDDPQVELKA